MRSKIEAFWDAICERIEFLPDDGVRMDRAIRSQISEEIVEELDLAAVDYADEAKVEEVQKDDDDLRLTEGLNAASIQAIQTVDPEKEFEYFDEDSPIHITMAELRELWKESLGALRAAASGGGNTPASTSGIPVGQYRIAVIPSIRSRSAGQVAIQGMRNKQIEMIVPAFGGGLPGSRTILAIWTYPNLSLAITFIDHMGQQHFICWDAPTSRQFNFDDPVAFNQTLDQLGLEVPSGLDTALKKR
jgi:serine/threonine-protein kinase